MKLQELPENFYAMTPQQLIDFAKKNLADNIDPWEDITEWFLHAYGSSYLIETKDGPMVPSWGLAAFRAELTMTILQCCKG